VDWKNILKNLVLIVGIVVIYLIANTPGWDGKIFALIIIGIVLWFYMRREKKLEIVNPVAAYFNNLVSECKLNHSPALYRLVLAGDHYDQLKVKGLILGHRSRNDSTLLTKVTESQLLDEKGKPIFNKDKTPVMIQKRVKRTLKDKKTGKTRDDPRHEAHVFLYTPHFGGIFNIPIIGRLAIMLWRREYLMCVYGNQLESKFMVGDVLVKGCNTRFISMMEFVNDDNLDVDHEMLVLSDEVDRLTLEDQLTREPTRIRYATDANSGHLRELDLRDDSLK